MRLQRLSAFLAAAALSLSLSGTASADCAVHSSTSGTTTITSYLTEADLGPAHLDLSGPMSLYGHVVDLLDEVDGSGQTVHLRTFGFDQHDIFVPLSAVSTGAWLRTGDVARVDIPAGALDLAGLSGANLQIGFEDSFGRDIDIVMPIAALDEQILDDTMVGVRDSSGMIQQVTLTRAIEMRDMDGTAIIVPDIDVAFDLDAELDADLR